jgi:glycosyltransferase involved in cell wall biosynthesis
VASSQWVILVDPTPAKDSMSKNSLPSSARPARPEADDIQVLLSLHEDSDAPRIVDAAIAQFHARYGADSLAPLVVVIAALNEEQSIGSVIDEVPRTVAELPTQVLVVDDGSTDKTSTVSDEHGALVCSLAQNCGHGTALRAGYRLAREGGARYIATLDADGQWDPADLPAMVGLLERDEADFVIGSRQLGRTENTDAVRNLGVRFFSKVISALTRTRLTDSSSGLRAMRVEVTEKVRQTQPQYQTSELLIGAIFQGYRVAEVPTVMRVRLAGVSKKGRNLFYGPRYAAVIVRTVRREWPDRVSRRPMSPKNQRAN